MYNWWRQKLEEFSGRASFLSTAKVGFPKKGEPRMSRAVLLFFRAATTLLAADSRDLLFAIRDGDRVHVQKLLRAGADVNTRDAEGTTALMHSVIESDANVM